LYYLSVSVSLLALLTVLVSLATHRVTRWVTRDKFPLYCVVRNKFVERWGVFTDAQKEERGRVSMSGHDTNLVMRSLAYAWECDWCTSIWVGAGLTYLTWRWTDTMIWVLMGIVASSVTGLIAQREPD
jgi:hypothetical protein